MDTFMKVCDVIGKADPEYIGYTSFYDDDSFMIAVEKDPVPFDDFTKGIIEKRLEEARRKVAELIGREETGKVMMDVP